jgi:hypothetical protein
MINLWRQVRSGTDFNTNVIAGDIKATFLWTLMRLDLGRASLRHLSRSWRLLFIFSHYQYWQLHKHFLMLPPQ